MGIHRLTHDLTPSGTVVIDHATRDGEIGSVIEYVRKRRGMSLRSLGDHVGCSHAYLSMVERGRKCPSAALLERIEHVLGIGQVALRGDAERLEYTTLAKLRVIAPQWFVIPSRGASSSPVGAPPFTISTRQPFDARVAIIMAALRGNDYAPALRDPTGSERKAGVVAVIELPDLGSGGCKIRIEASR